MSAPNEFLRSKAYSALRVFPLASAIWTGAAGTGAAQSPVDPEHGVVRVARALRSLGSVKRVLVIGAHPDDENTNLLTVLERGLGADAAYLSLNRGEGGQNLIGPELGVGLGLIRSEELLAARRLDGAEQFFTRAYDFGYSKSAEETFSLWSRDSLLADVVATVRRFRPQVIVSVFTGTSRDGHGQHQAAGVLAREAFAAAGDASRFSDQIAGGLEPWTPLKLYRSTRFEAGGPTLEISTGAFDPIYGRSYHQIAMASRSQHRSQDMGRIERLGPHTTALQLVASRVDDGAGRGSLFAGIDTTLTSLVDGMGDARARRALEERLRRYRVALASARDSLNQWRPSRSLPGLLDALDALRSAIGLSAPANESPVLRAVLDDQERELEAAIAAAAGVIVDAFVDDDLATPGQELGVEIVVWNAGDERRAVERVQLDVPGGWTTRAQDASPRALGADQAARLRFSVTVPGDAAPSIPYFLSEPRQGEMYAWPSEPAIRGIPFDPPLLVAEVALAVAGRPITARAEVVYRFADQALGEVRRPLRIVPGVAVELSPTMTAWPLGRRAPLVIVARLAGEHRVGVSGSVGLAAPPGWKVARPQQPFTLRGPGSATSVEFEVTAPAALRAGTVEFSARATTDDGLSYGGFYRLIDYPHIRRQIMFGEAVSRIRAFQLELPERPTLVGYVSGAGDVVAEAISTMGVELETLNERTLPAADLARYQTIVVGIRAYETSQALHANNERLLDWVRSGGTLIVQYQQYGFFRGGYAPYPMSARRPHDRVTNEAAPVRILDPEHSIFSKPNRIEDADFVGWVQERGLYFPFEWDDRYTPLVEMADPGEAPKRGALLVARVGSGLYIYTGLAFFRQVPHGVPGAYRLLMNLLSTRADDIS